MASCTSCGNDVTGKKFCPECGTPVQPTGSMENQPDTTETCPRCNGVVKAGSAFCMHCGSSLTSQTAVATATPVPTVPPQPLTRPCIACHTEIPTEMAFCTNCGQSMQVSAAPPVTANPGFTVCTSCGRQNNPGVNFCAGCGNPLSHQSQPYSQYPQQVPQYNAQYSQPYGQMDYQQQPMMSQQPMVLRCPICMAMSPLGTANCPSCRTSLAGVAPTPANLPMQAQQGGMGGLFQGQGGNMAMGALGGAAAVIGGEILIHELEGGLRRNHDDGLLGGLGDLANDVGLF